MKHIHVQSIDYETTYEGSKWVIDDNGRLHIVGTGGNVASFNSDQWVAVEFVGGA